MSLQARAPLMLVGCAALLLSCGSLPLAGDGGSDAGQGADAGEGEDGGVDGGSADDGGTSQDGGADGGATSDAGADGGAPHDAGGPFDAGDGDGGACGLVAPFLSAADRANSPRSNQAAEILAREASGALTAPDDLYARVDAELSAIRTASPWVQGIPVRSTWANDLIVDFDGGAAAAVAAAGGSPPWNCLNWMYGATAVRSLTPKALVVSFRPLLDLRQLATAYGSLPDVLYASPNIYGGGGPDTCLSVEALGDVFLFDLAGGDCLAGCTTHEFTGVLAAPDGGLSLLGQWNSFDGGAVRPAWLTSRSAACQGH